MRARASSPANTNASSVNRPCATSDPDASPALLPLTAEQSAEPSPSGLSEITGKLAKAAKARSLVSLGLRCVKFFAFFDLGLLACLFKSNRKSPRWGAGLALP